MAKPNVKEGAGDHLQTEDTSAKKVVAEKLVCGIAMPIAAFDGCDEGHWREVLDILTGSIEAAGFAANVVSYANEVAIIQSTIVHNLYNNPIVVCDVSGRNPNVMFELGLRLAFDEPTIIVKDDQTNYSFDTSIIEHLEYPRGLRHSAIERFKAQLAEKVRKTYVKATTDDSYTTFLKHFGEFKVAKIDQKEVSGQQFLIEGMNQMAHQLSRLEARFVASSEKPRPTRGRTSVSSLPSVRFCWRPLDDDDLETLTDKMLSLSEGQLSFDSHKDHYRFYWGILESEGVKPLTELRSTPGFEEKVVKNCGEL